MRSLMSKVVAQAWALCAALTLTGPAHAEIAKVTWTSGCDFVSGFTSSSGCDVQGSLALNLSPAAITLFNSAAVQASGVSPGVVTASSSALNVDLSLISLSGVYDTSTALLTISKIRGDGGVVLSTAGDGFASTGGALTLSRFAVDLVNQTIYADVQGSHGVSLMKQMPAWHYAEMVGPASLGFVVGITSGHNVFAGLTVTDQALDVFSQALGLTDAGRLALTYVTDFGSISSSFAIPVDGPLLPSVPESSTWLLMALGLVALVRVTSQARS